jgi:hypothetical protein
MVVRSAGVALRVVLVALVPITLGCTRLARLAPELIAPPRHDAAIQPIASSTDFLPPRTFTPAREREDDEIDLYGNDVSDAVAKYELDSDGSLYELHSPETQLPRLGSPKT